GLADGGARAIAAHSIGAERRDAVRAGHAGLAIGQLAEAAAIADLRSRALVVRVRAGGDAAAGAVRAGALLGSRASLAGGIASAAAADAVGAEAALAFGAQ